ncbi:cysteine proteinase [Meira miltonrushii]|uniref:Ubiquitin carboxyl-terminal hydrolase n=1 Tax=Meira miltonrushii TaxID=1280837 RepID=A0A316VH26_9BASI|nr:cysteine proteinase [Meira miltonrushii]PWN36846.1 cysteine proteinase [Meira miltonrushii]
MSAIAVKVKHNGKIHDVNLDPSQPATAFKQAIYEKTGVPLDRQKVMIKGGMLKDDSDLTKINARAGQTFMVIGTAGELPKAPTGPVTFLEDMTDAQLAQATKTKVGLTNLGNTCYLNSTLQVLRAIPELQTALNDFKGTMGSADGESNLTAALRDLYGSMGETSEAFPPLALLTILRQVAPQFAEMTSGAGGRGYAQQDAEEAWVRLVTALQGSLKGLSQPSSLEGGSASGIPAANFVEQFLTGRMAIKRSSPEAPTEEPTFSSDSFRVLQCNISSSTNEMLSGIMDSLNQQIEKNSSSLGRLAVYNEQQRIDRLPAYLTVHFVRFYWRRDIGKKTKIMRKVKFPFDLDVTQFLSDDLKSKVLPAKNKINEISKEREERAKIRRKVRAKKEEALPGSSAQAGAATTGTASADAPRPADPMAVDPSGDDVMKSASDAPKLGAALSEEEEMRLREKESKEAQEAIHPSLREDVGCNVSGLYELVGIVTHKGAAADAGHYISWVRKEDEQKTEAGSSTGISDRTPAEEEWYKFDDEKVTVVPRDKISSLDGGGEDSVAYILLYRSKAIQ